MKHQIPVLNRNETLFSFLFLFASFLLIPIIVGYFCDLASVTVSTAFQNFLCFLLNFLCVVALFPHFWLKNLKDIPGKTAHISLIAVLSCILYYISTLLLSRLILYIDPGFSNINDAAITAMVAEHRAPMLIGVTFLVPPVEEFLYRGFLFGKLYHRNRLLAYAVSITAFCAIHIVGYIGQVSAMQFLLCFLQYVPAGFFLAAAYAHTGNLFTPILVHTIINSLGVLSI